MWHQTVQLPWLLNPYTTLQGKGEDSEDTYQRELLQQRLVAFDAACLATCKLPIPTPGAAQAGPTTVEAPAKAAAATAPTVAASSSSGKKRMNQTAIAVICASCMTPLKHRLF